MKYDLPRQCKVSFLDLSKASIQLQVVLKFRSCAFLDFLAPFYVAGLLTRPSKKLVKENKEEK
jgi:hypothetical protein